MRMPTGHTGLGGARPTDVRGADASSQGARKSLGIRATAASLPAGGRVMVLSSVLVEPSGIALSSSECGHGTSFHFLLFPPLLQVHPRTSLHSPRAWGAIWEKLGMDPPDPTHRALVTWGQKCRESQRQGDSTEIAKSRKPPCPSPGLERQWAGDLSPEARSQATDGSQNHRGCVVGPACKVDRLPFRHTVPEAEQDGETRRWGDGGLPCLLPSSSS